MKKLVIFDIGELGWSMYHSAYVRWCKQQGHYVKVFTNPQFKCLYPDADEIEDIPNEIKDKIKYNPANCGGRYLMDNAQIKGFLKKFIPDGFEFSAQTFNCGHYYKGKSIFKPYKVKSKRHHYDVLVFPRHRASKRHKFRNLPDSFYKNLIDQLCVNLPDLGIASVGSLSGAYDIHLDHSNYFNLVSENPDLQDLIDMCHNALCTVGGTSAPPKIAMLQGIETYIIGHEKQRFTVDENWSNTEIHFWDIREDEYESFNNFECIWDIIRWVKE